MGEVTWSIGERFWKKVDRASEGCWEWQGARQTGHYGVFRIGPKLHPAHRVAYALVKRTIPAGLDVLHRCDNPPCCNPDHLFVGTALDNARDCCEKGRVGIAYGILTVGGSAFMLWLFWRNV